MEDNSGGGQKSKGVGILVSDRSDVPPRFEPDSGERKDEARSGLGVTLWDLFAKPFRGLFSPD